MILAGKLLSFSPLGRIWAVDFSQVFLIKLKLFLSVPTLLTIFKIMIEYWILSNELFASTDIIVIFFFFELTDMMNYISLSLEC